VKLYQTCYDKSADLYNNQYYSFSAIMDMINLGVTMLAMMTC